MCAALLPFCLQTHNPPPRGVPEEALPGLPALYFLLGSAKEGGKTAWGEREWSSDSPAHSVPDHHEAGAPT